VSAAGVDRGVALAVVASCPVLLANCSGDPNGPGPSGTRECALSFSIKGRSALDLGEWAFWAQGYYSCAGAKIVPIAATWSR
jgi:hypothetical protein